MWFDRPGDDGPPSQSQVARLENFHRGRHGGLLGVLLAGFLAFGAWAVYFRIDEVAKATGEVIASSRVQVIQAVDGGVISALLVKEGDRVKAGQILARLDQTRSGASFGEVEARLYALRAKALRLRAEVTNSEQPAFPPALVKLYPETAAVERSLFSQRRLGLTEELRTLAVGVQLAKKELALTEELNRNGDASGLELLRSQRNLNDAEARLVNRQNKFLEDARIELAKAEDEIAQNEQVLTRRRQERADSVFVAQVAGIVKNIRVTTVGGVLRAGEEIMQIVPVNDDLIVEAKVSPTDIARVHPGLEATVRFDPYDYTIHGSVKAKVVYVSADTLKEDTGRGKEIYYRVHVSPTMQPVTSTTGKALEIQPGMTAQLDIRTGDRSLMDYLLKPIRKTLAESLGER